MQKIYLESYGCASNLQDAQIIMGLLKTAGYSLVKNPQDADLNIINTCIVKTPSEQRMIHRIKQLQSTGKPLIVAGCMAKAEPEVVEKIAPRASLISPNSLSVILSVVETAARGDRVVALSDDGFEKPLLPHVRLNSIVEIIEVSSGCLSSCTFCQTKLARGELRSYRPSTIMQAVKRAVEDGCREVWLTSQDCSAYGRDIGLDLPTLLKSILKHVKGKYFIR
ncbi:MAG: radical SAM protein, partial [Aigarchaeota archaeon]|nr:radical SAM protein [Candidatus Calditenuaceae archaeon]